MAAGDFDAAITAAERALVIDQENPDALALKIKAEEAKRARQPAADARAGPRTDTGARTDAPDADTGAANAHTDADAWARRPARSRGRPPSR